MTEPTVRAATLADAAAIAEIYNASVTAGGATMDQELQSTEEIQRQIAALGARETILLLERPAQILGWGIIKQYSHRAGYRFTCETEVYLRRDLTRRGYGTRLKRALIDRCRDLGYHCLLVKIQATNTASLEYNKRLGYEVVGTQREVGFADGRWLDVVILQRVLDEVGPRDDIPDS